MANPAMKCALQRLLISAPSSQLSARSASIAHQNIPRLSRPFASASGGESPVFLVFGATGGIGSALAERLSQLHGGAKLVFSSNEDQKLRELKGRLKNAEVFSADAQDREAVERVVGQTVSKFGRLDGVASVVGDVKASSATTTTMQELDRILKLNLHTAFNVVHASTKAMLNSGGGSIVLVSAAVAEAGIPHFDAMAAAKAGVEGLTRSAAATYADHNIRVNCVAPGLTKTGQTEGYTQPKGTAEASKQMHPQKRFAEPRDIASALEFLLRPENSFITGQVLAVDGGLSKLAPQHAQHV